MSSADQEKNLKQENNLNQTADEQFSIPPQYQNLPSEVVEELWPEPILINGQPNRAEIEKRKLVLEKIKLAEIIREKTKTENMQNKYSSMTDEQKIKFAKAQTESIKTINQCLQNQGTINNLLPEEDYVLQKLKNTYQEFKKNNPDKAFTFDFAQEIDKKIYSNLIQRLAFKTLEIHLKNNDVEQANAVRTQLGIPQQNPPITVSAEAIATKTQNESLTDKDFEEFSVKNGETDIGVFWYEYRNTAAKKLKDSGELERGKERIYFDVPLDKINELKDLIFTVVKKEKIPIAFKHLDLQKTNQVDLKPDSETTRFVTNFASIADAKRFHHALKQFENYTKINSDRNLDYHGYNIDGLAHYASGYREQREPLLRIVKTAQKNPDNTYSYKSVDGSKTITISEQQYRDFVDRFNTLPDPEKDWNETKI